MYWRIEAKDASRLLRADQLSPITYGKIPPGYVQVYPEHGDAPPLMEVERYNVWAYTRSANGSEQYFTIRDGKAIEVPER